MRRLGTGLCTHLSLLALYVAHDQERSCNPDMAYILLLWVIAWVWEEA